MKLRSSHPRVAVLGGGITGLTAAWQLKRLGYRPVIFEKSSRVGGAVGTLRSDQWLHELGPNSLLEITADITGFIDEVGLSSRRIYASPAARKRYVVRAGRLVAMPTSPWGFVATRLFSWRAKLGLLGEPWRKPASGRVEESVADFVLRRLGREFLDYAVNPFVGGVYAGDPTRLSVQHAFPKLSALEKEHGSLLRGAWHRRNASGGPKGRMFSFPEGLAELPRALADALGAAIHLQTTVQAVRRTESGWEIDCMKAGQHWTEECAAVVCALPASALANLSFEGVPAASSLTVLLEVEHPPVASVFTGYRRADVQHPLDGFGALMPEVERGRILGTLFSSTLFPHRAPKDHVALTTFVGGMRQPKLASLDDDKLLDVVQSELARLVGVGAAPVFSHVQRWPKAIPQYTLGYQSVRDALAAVEKSAPGLFIGGNCRDGISLASCIQSGRLLGTCARQYVQSAGLQLRPASFAGS